LDGFVHFDNSGDLGETESGRGLEKSEETKLRRDCPKTNQYLVNANVRECLEMSENVRR
jgi:hypothetical protein